MSSTCFLAPATGRLLCCVSAVVLLLPHAGGSRLQADEPQVIELTADNREELVPRGKEVDAINGDLLLRNDFLTAVIARPAATRKIGRAHV